MLKFKRKFRRLKVKDQQTRFLFANAILSHSDHRHRFATHVVIFSVVNARIQIYLYYVKLIAFWLKFRANRNKLMRVKYHMSKIVVWNIHVVLWVYVSNRYIWWTMIQIGER